MSTPASPRSEPLLGATLAGRYRVIELLSEDPSGALLRAEDTLDTKRVAIRVLYAHVASAERRSIAEREAAVASRTTHPSVAAGRLAAMADDGSDLLVLPDLEPVTIRTLSEDGPVPLSRAALIAKQIALALEALHAVGVVHRALSPERVHIVTQSGSERDDVRITGFELAQLDKDPRAPALPQGSPSAAYAAPEVLRGDQVDGRADFYALGLIFYEMVTGSRPTPERSGSLPTMTSIRSVPVAVDALALRLLADDPSRRAAIAMDVVRALDALAEPQPKPPPKIVDETSPAPPPSAPRASSPRGSAPSSTSGTSSAPAVVGRAFMASMPDTSTASPRPRGLARVPFEALVYFGGVAAIVVLLTVAVAVRSPVVDSDQVLEEPRVVEAAKAPDDRGAEPPPKDPGEGSAAAREIRARMEKSLKTGPPSAFIADLERLLEIEPQAASDREIRASIIDVLMRIMIGGGADADKLFDIIATKMGAAGPDLLFELITTKGGSLAAKRADELMRDAALRSRGTPALRIAYDLRVASGCEAKADLLARARDDGDKRTLGQLQLLNQDCRRGECCLSNDPRLKEATEAIKARLR